MKAKQMPKRIEVKIPQMLLRKNVVYVSAPHWSPAPYHENGKRNKASRVVIDMIYTN